MFIKIFIKIYFSHKFMEINTSISVSELYRILIYARIIFDQSWNSLAKSRVEYPARIDDCASYRWRTELSDRHVLECRKGIKGQRARQGHRALSRLLDRQEASFSRVHADKRKQ